MHIDNRNNEKDPIKSLNIPSNVQSWVEDIATLCQPKEIYWCDGTQTEWDAIAREQVERGALIALNPELHPNSYLARSSPNDVARMESRTFICSKTRDDAGPTNNWIAPSEGRTQMQQLFKGCMRGRTLYVVPFSMGPIEAENRVIGIQLTDSPYAVLSMRIMTRIGRDVLKTLKEGDFFARCIHSVGAPLSPGDTDTAWPCNEEKWILHFPDSREVWSFGSGYGGNALLGKKCLALRIASVMARDEGWLAEHMLILKVTSPENKVHYIAGAFPSACGKTNLAMLDSTLPGWKVETLGDDICWMRIGADGHIYASNPETGFFGVAPGTSVKTNHNAIETMRANSIFTNTALTSNGDVWWKGLTDTPPHGLTDWRGRPWNPAEGPAMHPNARFTAPIEQCPSLAPEWCRPEGVKLSAILIGGRRARAVPLVTEALGWEHGVYLGATLASESTAASEHDLGTLRRDPFAMNPFCGYNIGDYFAHWLSFAKNKHLDVASLPKFFMVNWFRTNEKGEFVWPGFGDNIRVLKWIVGRLEGSAEAVTTPIGKVPSPESLDTEGLSLNDQDLAFLLNVDKKAWQREAEANRNYLTSLGDRIPARLFEEQEHLEDRLKT